MKKALEKKQSKASKQTDNSAKQSKAEVKKKKASKNYIQQVKKKMKAKSQKNTEVTSMSRQSFAD